MQKQIEELERQITDLKRELRNESRQRAGTVADDRAGRDSNALTWPTTPAWRPRSSKSVRDVLLEILADLGWPAYSRQLALYADAVVGRHIPSVRFGVLAKDEMTSFLSRRSTGRVFLCFGLTHDRHEPIRRLWARSDWPLESRIVGPMSGRIQHLKATKRFCELAAKADEVAAHPDMLRQLAMTHAMDLPGVKARPGAYEFSAWRDAADRLLTQLEPEDQEIRRTSADRLSARPEQVRLFGMPDVIDGGRADTASGGR